MSNSNSEIFYTSKQINAMIDSFINFFPRLALSKT